MIDNARHGPLADCYVLASQRTKEFIYSFLDNFIPNRQETSDEYEIPQYSENPKKVYTTAEQLIDYLIANKTEIHTIYWRNTAESVIKLAMCYFIEGGHLITGLACLTDPNNAAIENQRLKELQKFCVSSDGYIAYEEPAAPTIDGFLQRVQEFYSQGSRQN